MKGYLVWVEAAPFDFDFFSSLDEAFKHREYLACKSDDIAGRYEILEVSAVSSGRFEYNEEDGSCTFID